MTAPLEKVIKIILTSIERGYHALNLRSSAFICGSFLICVSEYNYSLRLLKKRLIDEGFELSDKIVQLKVESTDGKNMKSYAKNHFHAAFQILFYLTDFFALQEIPNEGG
ncbi:Uncharacterised protein [uncultured archaeon]|nr:Uncharacterised protein [uncultured archaeon]